MSFLIGRRSRSRRRAANLRFLLSAAAGNRYYAEALERRRLLAAISWTGSADHMSWNLPRNWSSDTVPTASDDVTINTVDTIQSNATQAVHNLTFTAGAITGTGELDVGGAFHWTNGILSDSKTVVAAAGSMAFDFGDHQLNGELNLNGPTTWTGGNIGLSGGTINNSAAFTATAPMNSAALQMVGNGTGVNAFNIQAAGSFVANGLGAVRIFTSTTNIPFNNAGSTSVQSGTLQLGSTGTSTGSFSVAAEAALTFANNYTFGAGNSASGSGLFQFAGGTQTLATNQTFPNLTLNNPGGVEVGPGSLTVTGLFQWISGTLSVGTKTTVSSPGSLTLDIGSHQLNGELNLDGPATWTGGDFGLAGGTINNNATFTATALMQVPLSMFGNGSGVNAFNNQAADSFVANGPGSVRIFTSKTAVPFNNAGDVSVQSGTLQLESDSSHTGNFDGQAGATLLFMGNQTFAASSHINGNLNLEIDFGTGTYPNGLNTTGTVTFLGGSFTIGGNVTAGSIVCIGLATGVLNGATNDTSSLFTAGGKLELGGSLTIHYVGAPFLTPTIRAYLQTGNLAPSTAGGALGYADGADGIVANLSAGQFLTQPAIPGDANLDGNVGFPDLVLLARHYGATNVGWDVGDFNFDAKVGFDDLVTLARHYGKTGPAAAALAGRASVLAATTPVTLQPSSRKHRIII